MAIFKYVGNKTLDDGTVKIRMHQKDGTVVEFVTLPNETFEVTDARVIRGLSVDPKYQKVSVSADPKYQKVSD